MSLENPVGFLEKNEQVRLEVKVFVTLRDDTVVEETFNGILVDKNYTDDDIKRAIMENHPNVKSIDSITVL